MENKPTGVYNSLIFCLRSFYTVRLNYAIAGAQEGWRSSLLPSSASPETALPPSGLAT